MELNHYDNLVEATQDLGKRGYDGQFKYADGMLVNTKNDNSYTANQLTIVEYHRFEGMTNPADNSVVFAIETVDNQNGTLIMSYSADADMDLVSFIDAVKIKASDETIA